MEKTRILLILSIFLFTTGCLSQYITEQPTNEDLYEIDTSQEPIQEPYSGGEIHKAIDGTDFTIVPVATYEASVLVICRKYYNRDEVDTLTPLDVCVVWGKLAEPGYIQYYTCTQDNRGCRLTARRGSPLSDSYVESHFTNIHIIPAHEEILKAIKTIRINEKVVLEGFLVNVYSNGAYIWKTSLRWDDSGTESCEVLYVTKIIVNGSIVE
jgi:hypothetical protein